MKNWTTLPLLLALTACDAGQPQETQTVAYLPLAAPPVDGPTAREYGPPWMYYSPYAMDEVEFEVLLEHCPGVAQAKLTTSLSGYDPEINPAGDEADLQVIGLGFSFMGTPEDRKCLTSYVVDIGFVSI